MLRALVPHHRRTAVFVSTLCAIAGVSVALLYRADPVVTWQQAGTIAILTLVALTADGLTYELADYASGTIASMPYLAAVLLVPQWLTVVAVAATSVLTIHRVKSDRLMKGAFNIAQATIGVALAVAAYRALGGQAFADIPSPTFVHLTHVATGPVLGAALALLLSNSILLGIAISLHQGKPLRHVWFKELPRIGLGTVVQAPLVFLFAWLYVAQGPMAAAILLATMLLVRWGQMKNAQLERTNRQLLELIVRSMEAQSRYTSGHSQRVQRNCVFIAREILKLSEREVDQISIAALLHDIGKIGEKYSVILNKEGKLTPDERLVMQEHAPDGANLISTMATFREIVPMVRHHHEHWDGSGYPDGLMGDRIPLTSRIIMFADTIDAMTSTRPYRRALTPADVRSEIFKFRGRQFDPKVADLLLSSPRWDELFLDAPFRVIRGSLGAHNAQIGSPVPEPLAKESVALRK
jgi:hypothetical protein